MKTTFTIEQDSDNNVTLVFDSEAVPPGVARTPAYLELTKRALEFFQELRAIDNFQSLQTLLPEERRAPVQGGVTWERRMRGKARDEDKHAMPPGTITWDEHVQAWTSYSKHYGKSQSAEHMVERGGFGYNELLMFLGHHPTTWQPRPSVIESYSEQAIAELQSTRENLELVEQVKKWLE